MNCLECDIAIIGGGTGGTAAAIALVNSGYKVILTEESDWLGGQLTSQCVPPDEHKWIEYTGCTQTYRTFRNLIREHYFQNKNLKKEAKQNLLLNPGGGWVSRLCFEPEIGYQVLLNMLGGSANKNLQILKHHIPIHAETRGDMILSVTAQNTQTRDDTVIKAKFFLDATELGDLLPLSGTEYNIGAESKTATHEPNALTGKPDPLDIQSFTWCALLGYDPNSDNTIEKPREYDFWKEHQPPNWPDKLLSFSMLHVQTEQRLHFPLFENDGFNLFSYRQIIKPEIWTNSKEQATCMNWPMNDYALGTVIDQDEQTVQSRLESSKQLTLSMIYWLQTEAGYPGIKLLPELAKTPDGLAKTPYHRESRRIKARFTVKEQDIATYTNPGYNLAPELPQSVGVGAYRIDIHPSSQGRKTIDTSTLPFQIPFGSLIPIRMKNLLPACKNIGTTHITNGCYRLHPIEWNIGEVAGLCAAYSLLKNLEPHQILENESQFEEFAFWLESRGIQRHWPEFHAL